jgi:Flp pilus assembly protein TadD
MTRYSFVSDHWQYFGCMSVIALVAAGISRGLDKFEKRSPFLKPIFCGTLLLVLGVLSWRQAEVYLDAETLWRDTLAKNPNCWMAHYNLGFTLEQQGQIDEAVTHFQEDIRLKPDNIDARIHLGIAFYRKGQIDEAISQFQEAIRLNPDSNEAHNDLGIALIGKKQIDEAISQYKEAIRLKPDNAAAHQNLGDALVAKSKFDEAVECYRQAIQINPKVPEFFTRLGVALDQSGRTHEAATQYREALRLDPDQILALNNLAWELATSPDDQLRNGAEAVQLAERACELTNYERPQFIGTLAAAYAEAGRFEDAVAASQKAYDLAFKMGRQKLALKDQELLQLFKNHKPCREKPGQSD